MAIDRIMTNSWTKKEQWQIFAQKRIMTNFKQNDLSEEKKNSNKTWSNMIMEKGASNSL